jgi:hypothetical protein
MATLLRTIRNTIHRLSLRRRKKHNRRKSENTADEDIFLKNKTFSKYLHYLPVYEGDI